MPRGSLTVVINPPEQGARGDAPPHLLPVEAFVADQTRNVVMRDGGLVNRPGLGAVGTNAVTGRPMGGYFFKPGTSKFAVVGTTTGWWRYNSGTDAWVDISGSALSGTGDDPVRFVVFPQGGVDYLIGTNKANTIKEWDGSAATYSDLGGSPPRAGDLTISTNRVIAVDTVETGTPYIYRVRWSNFNDRATWTATDFADLSDTADPMVGCRELTRVAFAIYKESSQWIGLAQAGTFPFRFELQDRKPGPLGPAAVVQAEGRHYYMAQDGSIYMFDGIHATHVGEPVRRFLIRNLNFNSKRRAFGVFSRRDRDIYWVFPTGGKSDPDVAISMNVDSGRFFIHELRRSLSCGFEWEAQNTVTWNSLTGTWDTLSATYSTWDSFGGESIPAEIMGATSSTIYRFGVDATDAGLNPAAKWRTATLQPAGESKRTRIQSLDTFFTKTTNALTVTTKIGTTDTLGADPTFPAGLTDTHAVGTDELHQANYDTDEAGADTGKPEARFITVQHEVTTDQDWTWHGAHVRGYPLETS